MAWTHERRRSGDSTKAPAVATYAHWIEQLACPAYFCTLDGAVLYCNGSAIRLWGAVPLSTEDRRWDGFSALYHRDGAAVDKSASPAAQAARTGLSPAPIELVAESSDGQRRSVVIHAHPVRADDGTVAGVLCSVTDISERRRLEGEVIFLRESRAEFLRVLAHELRNPLAPVMAGASILRRQPDELGVARIARVLERQTMQLARFIDDLLVGTRIEQACEIPVSMRVANLDSVLAHARDVVDCALRERGQTLHVQIAGVGRPLNAVLWCDPERLGQALGNALLNGSQFSDNGAAVALSISIDGVVLEIQVSDEGIGVDAGELLPMFEPFRKFATHPERVESGAGLGLAIARSVTTAHGGKVTASSAGRGCGTRLTFVLPVVMDAPFV